MKIFVLLCLASAVFASKIEPEATEDLAKAKIALDQLTFSKEEQIYNVEGDAEQAEEEGGYENDVADPCADFVCRVGWTCVVDRINSEPFCDCAASCPAAEESDDEVHRTHVCSTENATYTNLCEFHRQKCLDAAMQDALVDYYGECQEFQTCQADDLAEYPARMTQWFLESLEYLMDISEEHGGLSQKEKDVLKEPRKPEAQAIYWKFRRLDKNPADLYLDFAELEPLRAPITLLEPCTRTFLAACDADGDELINAIEFGRCLNLDERDIEY